MSPTMMTWRASKASKEGERKAVTLTPLREKRLLNDPLFTFMGTIMGKFPNL
jgi:hypothetical protein